MNRPARQLGRRLTLFLLAILPALALLLAESYVFDGDWTFPLDDSWIHLVFARNLAGGGGLAFHPGELVAATTAPLWTAWLALISLLPGSILLWTKASGIAAHGLTIAVTWVLARRLGLSSARSGLAALLVATTDWLVWSSLSGMEIPLFSALTLLGMARHLEERRAISPVSAPPLSLLIFALAALTRPEGLLLIPLALLDRALRLEGPPGQERLRFRAPGFRLLLVAAAVVGLVVLPVAWVFDSISGSPFPTTLVAKSTGPPTLVPEIRYLRAVVGILFPSQPWMTLLALGGVAELVRRLGTRRDCGLLLALWAVALPVASAMLSSGPEIQVGNFGRYFFPLFPVVVLLGMLALERLSFSRLRTAAGPLVSAVALVALLLPTLLSLVGGFGRYLTSCANVRDGDVALARWLAPRLDPEAVLAVVDIGALQYYLPNRLIDLGGLVTPELNQLRLAGAREGKSYRQVLGPYLEAKRPDFIVVFPEWYPEPSREPERFPVVRALEIRDNITLGGDMILVHRTPWNRFPLREVPEGVTPADPGTDPQGTP